MQQPSVRDAIARAADTLRHAGGAGVAVWIAGASLALAVAAPTLLLSALAGYIWGVARGFLVALVVVTLGTFVGHRIAASLLRERIRRQISGDPRLRALVHVVETDGFRILLLLRVAPVFPQNLLGYFLGVSRLRARDFVTATFLGMAPITVAHVYLGSLARDAQELVERGGAGQGSWAFMAGATAASVFGVLLLVRVVRRRLGEVMGAALRDELEHPRGV